MAPFALELKIEDKDVNYRQHVSYDRYFAFFQEARIAYLAKLGHDLDGAPDVGLIATEARCAYKKELRLGDVITVQCRVQELRPKAVVMGFLVCQGDLICADGSVTLLCYDYAHRKVTWLPAPLVEDIKSYEGLT
jgi:acyl-CoA thioester hydrolase